MITRKQVSMSFVGHIHRDPISFIILMIMVEMARQRGIPVVFCAEDFSGQTCDNWIKGNKEILEINSKTMADLRIQKLIKHDLSRPYLSYDDRVIIKEIIASFVNNPTNIPYLYNYMLRNHAYQDSINFISYLKEVNVPLVGIEYAQEEYKKHVQAINSANAFMKAEQDRIKNMVSNIATKGLSELTGDGIVIVLTGVNHTHRLAANFLMKYASDTELRKRYDIKIFPFKVFSPYVTDGIKAHEKVEAESRKSDSADILRLYGQLPCSIIHCKDMKLGTKDEKELPADLKPIMGQMFQHLLPKVVSIVVPKYDEKTKKSIIERFKGKIIKVDKNGYATIEINPVDLKEMKKDTREALGIQRSLAKKLKKEQYDFLKQDKTVTIEETDEPGTFFLTFPDDRLKFIDKVCKEWAVVEAKKKFFEEKFQVSSKAYKRLIKIQQRTKIKKAAASAKKGIEAKHTKS